VLLNFFATPVTATTSTAFTAVYVGATSPASGGSPLRQVISDNARRCGCSVRAASPATCYNKDKGHRDRFCSLPLLLSSHAVTEVVI
jgi:hypothetical protein